MRHIGIYYRVSTDRQDLASQEIAVQQWLDNLPESRKPKTIKTFSDTGLSGRTTRRPGLQSLLDTAMAGKIDTIVVYKLDRFSRQANAAIRMILNLDSAGVAFISVSQPVLNLGHENPFRRTMIAAFAEIAEIERETIVARVQAGLMAARKRGVVLGAPRKINTSHIEKVHSLRKKGFTIRSIARTTGLSTGSVSRVLKNPPDNQEDA